MTLFIKDAVPGWAGLLVGGGDFGRTPKQQEPVLELWKTNAWLYCSKEMIKKIGKIAREKKLIV